MLFTLRTGLLPCLLLLLFSAGSLLAQNGIVQGTVLDPQGGAIPNASVSATDDQKGVVVRKTTSGADGNFQLQPLPPGTYTVTAESPGMKKFERTNVVLDVNQTLNLGEVRMEVGSTSEAVTVEASSPLVESTTSNKSFTINSEQVTETSTNGRDFQSLMRTLPGVVSNDSSDFRLAFNNTDAFHVNGLRGSANNVFLDGSINTDVGANDGQYTQLSLDAVGEFKVQTSTFNAEYGRIAGVLISATTKSGGQQFHGTLYEFLRNDAMDANSFFNNLQGLQRSPLRFNQFGGNLGGPVYIPKLSPWNNKKLFFFFNYEGTRASRPNGNSYYDVPAPALLTGDFTSALRPTLIAGTSFPVGTIFRPGSIVRDNAGNVIGGTPYTNNIIPPAQFSSQAAAFQKLLGTAYRGAFTQTPNTPDSVRVPFQDTYRFDKDQKALRVDYNISAKANAFFRWVDDAQRESQGFGIFSGNTFPVLPEFREKPGASWSWNLINTFSPTATNEFIFTYNHLTQDVNITGNTNPSTYQASALGFSFQQLYPNSNITNRFPSLSAGGFNISPFPPTWQSEAKTFAWTDNFTKVLGDHTLKTGVFVDINTAGQQPYWVDAPNLNFNPNQQMLLDTNNGVANLLLGNYYSVSQANGKFFGSFKFYQTEAYVQDSWKASRKLTLEYGVRWAYLGPTFTHGKYLENYWDPTRYNPAQAVSINTAPGLTNGSIIPNSGDPYNGIVREGTNGIPSGFAKHRYNNWSPRFGFAYDPTGSGRTAIRGGAGVFYERIRQNVNSFDALGNPPLSYTPTLFNGNIDGLSPSLVSSGPLFPVSINTFNKEGKIPTTYSWSLGIQHQLTGNTALDISYVGNVVNHLQYQVDLNQLPLGTTTSSPILASVNNTGAAIRPYKGFNNINYTDFGANSNYNALQVQLTRRFTKDIMISANYTWSKALDIIDSDSSQLVYAFDRQREYGPADFDRTHVFTLNYVYTLPTLQNHNSFVKYTLGGWEITGITRFWSGTPFSVLSPNTNPGTLDGGGYGTNVRANFIGGSLYPDHKSWQEWYNPFAFARPLDGTLGATGRNFLRGPGINNWDISLFKNFNFSERIKFQLRGETFNTFNHTQLGGGSNDGVNNSIFPANPGNAVTSSIVGTSGQINSARDPRTIQIGAKFLF